MTVRQQIAELEPGRRAEIVTREDCQKIADNATAEALEYIAKARKYAKTQDGVFKLVVTDLIANTLLLAKIGQKRRSELEARVAALEARTATLEAEPRLRFLGVHEPGRVYSPGCLVVRSGGLWHCNNTTTKTPGTSSDWQLAVKSGEAAKGVTVR